MGLNVAGTKDITERPPFVDLFPWEERTVEAIVADIAINGFDDSEPLAVWMDGAEVVLIDGHTRMEACRRAGVEEVPIYVHNFGDEDEALAYAIHKQRDRRNLTDADLLRLVPMLDERKKPGPKSFPSSEGKLPTKGTAVTTAATVGTSRAKVEKTRAVIDHGTPEVKADVLAGKKTINKAYTETQEARKHEDPPKKTAAKFNRTDDKSIEWAWWTWNPVKGCEHGCSYCYAAEIAIRFHGGDFRPKLVQHQLAAPKNTKVPLSQDPRARRVFVCSMADLFGAWVPQEWIDKVFAEVRSADYWTYLFLTKNPERLAEIDWPSNTWAGASGCNQHLVDRALGAFENVNAPVRFLSCEPLHERIDLHKTKTLDLVIIGAQSKALKEPEFQPEWAWVEDLMKQCREIGAAVYFKPTLTARPKEHPTGR